MIPFIDLRTQQNKIKEKIDINIAKVLDHGQYIMGPEVKELEGKLADYVGVKHCIAVANGTDALMSTAAVLKTEHATPARSCRLSATLSALNIPFYSAFPLTTVSTEAAPLRTAFLC